MFAQQPASAACVRGILEGMSEKTYASLSLPTRFADSCMEAVERAVRQRNARLVWEWIDAERQSPSPDALVECIDLAIKSITVVGSDSQSYDFAQRIQRDCREYLGYAAPTHDEELGELEILIDGISMSIWTFDPALHDHCAVVAQFARRIATHLGLHASTAAAIATAGRVHEIGKLRASAQLTGHAGILSATDRNHVRRQVREGTRVLQRHPLLATAADIVDGALHVAAGESCAEIESKVLAAADVFHTLLQERPYRTPFTPSAVIAHLDDRSSLFGRDVVDALAAMCGHRAAIRVSA